MRTLPEEIFVLSSIEFDAGQDALSELKRNFYLVCRSINSTAKPDEAFLSGILTAAYVISDALSQQIDLYKNDYENGEYKKPLLGILAKVTSEVSYLMRAARELKKSYQVAVRR